MPEEKKKKKGIWEYLKGLAGLDEINDALEKATPRAKTWIETEREQGIGFGSADIGIITEEEAAKAREQQKKIDEDRKRKELEAKKLKKRGMSYNQ